MTISASACIIVGIVAILFRDRLAQFCVNWNYKLIGVRYKRSSYAIGFAIGGALLIISGLVEGVLWMTHT
jgi:hypothetical protein